MKKNRFHYLILILFYVHTQHTYSQSDVQSFRSAKIESLKSQLLENSSDSLKAITYNALSWEYHRTDLEESYAYAKKAENLSQKNGFKGSLARAYNLLGIYYSYKQQKVLSVKLNEKALELALGLNDSFLISAVYNDIGLEYMNDPSKHDKASEYLHESLNYTTSTDTIGLVFGKGNLSQLYYLLGDSLKSAQLLSEAEIVALKSQDPFILLHGYNIKLESLIEQSKYQEAIKMNDVIIEINRDNKDYLSLAHDFSTHAYLYESQNNQELARNYYNNAIDICRDKGFDYLLPIMEFYLEELNFENGDKSSAINKMESIVKSMGSIGDKLEFTKYISEYHEESGNHIKALEFFKSYHHKSDSLKTVRKLAATSQFEVLYETEKKEKANQLLKNKQLATSAELAKRKNQFFWLAILTLPILLMLFWYYWQGNIRKRYNLKLSKEVEEKTKSLKKLNVELNESNSELERFTYIAAHDLKTPLRNITSFNALLKKKLADRINTEEKEYFAFIENGSKWMKDLIDDLLIYSNQENNIISLDRIQTNSLLDETMLLLESKIKQRSVTINRDIKETELYIDKNKIKQILENLFSNSIKFTPQERKPVIDLKIHSDRDLVYFEISDNGIGINGKYLEQVFKPFSKLHPKDKFEGSGIGLSICKRLLKNMEGDITFNQNEHQGVTFKFFFPKIIAPVSS